MLKGLWQHYGPSYACNHLTMENESEGFPGGFVVNLWDSTQEKKKLIITQ